MINKKHIIILMLILATLPIINAFECGDKVCEIAETYNSCPADCQSGGADNYCDKVKDNICDPDCFGQDPDCEGYKTTMPTNSNQIKGLVSLNTEIMIGLFFLIGFIIFIILRIVSKQKGLSYLDIKQRQKQEAETKQNPAENPFNKYKYLFKK